MKSCFYYNSTTEIREILYFCGKYITLLYSSHWQEPAKAVLVRNLAYISQIVHDHDLYTWQSVGSLEIFINCKDHIMSIHYKVNAHGKK